MSKKIGLLILFAFMFIISGCSDKQFDGIDPHQSFIASLNILEPSLQFFDAKQQQIAKWPLEKAYTGAVLVQQDTILLYGHQLETADLYELSSGKKVAEIATNVGTTNGIYDNVQRQIFLTNSKTNTVTSYDVYGKKLHEQKVGNYPMSMITDHSKLYVVNFKDTKLSVLTIDDLKVVDEWQIEKSSHGMAIIPEQNILWLGGHGEGSRPNQTVDVYNITTGKRIKEVAMPLMPVGFYQTDDEILAVSHGENILYVADETGALKWQKEIAANPFSVAAFHHYIVVGGYDDQKLYFINEQQEIKDVSVGKGPFQLLVRE